LTLGIIQHVVEKEKPFEDGFLFFSFTSLAKSENFKTIAKDSYEVCSSMDVWKKFIYVRFWILRRENSPWIMFGLFIFDQ
jgi:hypothetical protein